MGSKKIHKKIFVKDNFLKNASVWIYKNWKNATGLTSPGWVTEDKNGSPVYPQLPSPTYPQLPSPVYPKLARPTYPQLPSPVYPQLARPAHLLFLGEDWARPSLKI